MIDINSLEIIKITSRSLVGKSSSLSIEMPDVLDVTKSKFSGISEKLPDIEDLDHLSRRFQEAHRRNDWTSIKKKDWRKFPWLLFDDTQVLSKDMEVVNKYISTISQKAASRFIKTLIYVYLYIHPVDNPVTILIRGFIADSLARIEKGTLVAWKERGEKFSLFSGNEAARVIASAIMLTGEPSKVVLEQAGLTGALSSTGLSKAAYQLALKTLGNKSHNEINIKPALVENIIDWSIDKTQLRYPGDKILMINSLLKPWLDENPNDEIRDKILQFLLNNFDDPRINTGNWQGLSSESYFVINKWLVKETLEDFFKILDKTAMDKHWKYRHKYWLAYHEKSAIDAAWIALGPQARVIANQVFDQGFSAASLTGSGVQQNQSVLLMKIGGLIIAEWSHNGKCRAWYATDSHAPPMNKRMYTRNQLTEYSNQIVDRYIEPGLTHHGSEEGKWQGQLSAYINNETGIYVGYSEYM